MSIRDYYANPAPAYAERINSFLKFIEPVYDRIRWNEKKQYDVNHNYSIDKRNTIFVQNAELHMHGFNAADPVWVL